MTFEGDGTGDTPLMAWNRLGSLFALHSASYQGAFDESAFSCSYFGLEQLVTLSGSLPGSVPAVAVRPTSSSMCLLASSIAAGCTFCSQRRFKVIAAVKVPIASREKLLAGKQEVAEVAEVAGDAERVHNGGSKATGSPPLVHREKQEASRQPTAARSEQAADSSKSSGLRREPRALIDSPHAACCRGHRLPASPSWDRIWHLVELQI